MATDVLTHVLIVAVECGQCGVPFGMSAEFIAQRRKDHETWYCPNGHPRVYTGKNEAEKLRDELAREKHRTEQAQANAAFWQRATTSANEREQKVSRSLRATKAVVTRTKKKIVAGRCPCCSYEFKNLKTHMATKHPAYDPEKAVAAMEAKA